MNEFLREVGIGLGVATPICLGALFVLKTYTRAEINAIRAAFQQELDARTIEFAGSHVTVEQFRHCQRLSNEKDESIVRRLEAIDNKLDKILLNWAGRNPSNRLGLESD